MTDTRTDEEVLCEFMEARPDVHSDSDVNWNHRWWRWYRDNRGHLPRTLDLDALREIEERLTDEQWRTYESLSVDWWSGGPKIISGFRAIRPRLRRPENQGTGYRGEGRQMRIMVRSAEDDFIALRMMNAMESAGAVVFAIAPNGTSTYEGALLPHQRFQVWAKVQSDTDIGNVDIAIDKELNEDDHD